MQSPSRLLHAPTAGALSKLAWCSITALAPALHNDCRLPVVVTMRGDDQRCVPELSFGLSGTGDAFRETATEVVLP
jgi:hypothetical protein